ncbi:hypothetical protein WP50_28840 [Lactiplantibacillus plantarum]|nr:hypothetical protein WP50_28840 [Lactiplantibacillus plantarum]
MKQQLLIVDAYNMIGNWPELNHLKQTDRLSGAVGLIIGNEGKGISPLLKKSVDEMLTIPMIGHVQSLNASVAASLLIYQGYTSRHPLGK